MEKLVNAFLQPPPQGAYELEARFRGYANAPLLRSNYNNAVRALGGLGFTQSNSVKLLRITMQGVRVELSGLYVVQTYCRTDELPASATFQRKKKVMTHDTDYGMRLALSTEQALAAGELQQFRTDWASHPKRFRFMHRISFQHPEYPDLKVDCSVVKSSTSPQETFAQSDVDSVPGTYEVEVEALHSGGLTAVRLLAQLRKVSTSVIGGIQNTPFPIPHAKMDEVVKEYSALLRIEPHTPPEQRFVGPNPVALQYHHLARETENYVVTDKADGLRKLLFVNADGAVFFLTQRMTVEYANCICREMRGTILDGEFIEKDKDGKTLQLYAVFDVYALKGADCRTLPFIPERRRMLVEAVEGLQADFRYKITAKTFYRGKNVHEAAKLCLTTLVPYVTDGLIFTPADKGVGVTDTVSSPPNHQFTWDSNYKWKPPQHNTIDFAVTVKESEPGRNLLVLKIMCKGSKNWDKPQEVLLMQTDPAPQSAEGLRPFITEEDPNSYLCYLNVVDGKMVTEDGDTIEAGMVVEFRYDDSRPELWKWVPTRIRWDKTAPNSFLTAHNNWETIQNPITEEMVKGTQNLTDHRYYVGDKNSMKNIRNFHRFVKGEVLHDAVEMLRKEGKTSLSLCDLAVGQAGDIWRWRNLRLAFVFGIDINKHNLFNKQDGACIRYLTSTKRNSPMYAIFVQGDSSKNLLEDGAHEDALDGLVTRAILGKGDVTPAQVHKYPNVATHFATKFHICSMMFAIHYMFKSNETLDQFLHNVATCTSLGGYFVGTAWDGKTVFKRLASVPKDEVVVFDDVAITKNYDEAEFSDDSSCVGYGISVSQNTYNTSVEYLVNYTYLETALESFGFQKMAVMPFKTLYGKFSEHNAPLNEAEKEVSFMNSYFVFKKVSDPEAFETAPSFTRVGVTQLP